LSIYIYCQPSGGEPISEVTEILSGGNGVSQWLQANTLPFDTSLSSCAASSTIIYCIGGGSNSVEYRGSLLDSNSISSPGGDALLTYILLQAGTQSYTVNATDAGTTTPFNISAQNTILVYPPLNVSISPLSNTIIFGNAQTLTATVTGGTSPYTYNWQVFNTLGIAFNGLYSSNSYAQKHIQFLAAYFR
jgi:hypothetical protein